MTCKSETGGSRGSGAIGPAPGTYVLLLGAAGGARVRAGRCGTLITRPGCYLYVGSAFGPGGVGARVRHHRRFADSPRWHIDYLRPATELLEIWYAHDPERLECAWADALARMPGAAPVLDGFGASDCRCRAHLVHFESPPAIAAFRRHARARLGRPCRIRGSRGC